MANKNGRAPAEEPVVWPASRSLREGGRIPLGGTVSRQTIGAIAELAQLMEAADDPKSAIDLRERMAEIELALEDLGWVRMGWQTQGELSRDGLRRLITICRQLYLKHPLINHAINVQTNYVWGQGISVVAKAEEINAVIQAWWDLRENKAELTGHRARMLKEKELAVAGNIFLALFTEPTRGTVRVRSIEVGEIEEIIANPEDRREPWYYHRRWQQPTSFDPAAGFSTEVGQVEAYHPDWLYRPEKKPAKINGIPVKWDAPVYHMKVGGLDNMRFGVPTIFPAIDWARAVQKDLENYATVKASLARYSTLLTVKGSPATVAAAKAMLATTVGSGTFSGESNPPAVPGSTFIQREGAAKFEPVRTAGIQANPDEGRRLGLMVSAGTGIPETMLWGDATLGNYATAKSLDRPTELQMAARQQDWVDTFVDLSTYVLDQTATAAKGQLKCKIQVDLYSGAKQILILGSAGEAKGKPLDRRVDVEFPAILEHDRESEVRAITLASTLGGKPFAGLVDPRTIARLLLVALGVNNVDEVLQQTHPDEPNPPQLDPGDPKPPEGTGRVATNPPTTTPPMPVEKPAEDTPAATEAHRLIREAVQKIGELRVPDNVDPVALVQAVAESQREALMPLLETLGKQAEATTALAGRPLAIDVKLPETPPARRVVRETKFKADAKGQITGKTETETEEEA